MTDHGDDSDDDPQLGGLRAIWLAMPDEDPPERGLADLMAAARVKAEEMAQPSLWQRIVAMMRRPPALALATLMVLVAGAVLVGNRRDKMDEVSPVADQPRAPEVTAEMKAEPAPVAAPTPAQGEVPASAVAPSADSPSLETTTAHDPAVGAQEKVAVEKKPSKRAPSTSATKPKADAFGRDEDQLAVEGGRGVATGGLAKSADARREAKKDAPPVRTEASNEKLQIAEPEAAPDEAQVQIGGSRPPVSTVTAAPAGDALADSERSAGKTKQTGVAQLHVQARTAASRNDCAAVKAIAQRIAKQDPAYYRANVVKDTTLGKCIGTPAQ